MCWNHEVAWKIAFKVQRCSKENFIKEVLTYYLIFAKIPKKFDKRLCRNDKTNYMRWWRGDETNGSPMRFLLIKLKEFWAEMAWSVNKRMSMSKKNIEYFWGETKVRSLDNEESFPPCGFNRGRPSLAQSGRWGETSFTENVIVSENQTEQLIVTAHGFPKKVSDSKTVYGVFKFDRRDKCIA